MEDRITIHQLSGRLVAELRKSGFCESTIWQMYVPKVRSIERYYKKLGVIYYDPTITDEFVSLQWERMKRGESSNYGKCLYAAKRLNELFLTGKISVPQSFRGT